MSIDIRNISYSYNKGTSLASPALIDVNLTINKGDFVGIIGGVGSGKTTLVRHLNGLLEPDTGEVRVEGVPAKERRVRERIGMLFQHPENQLFCRTVREDIGFGPSNFGISGEMLEERIIEAAEMVGLEKEILERSPFSLSGGQMRRAALAGVLAMEPEYLVLDEPTSGLDPGSRDEFLSRLKEMHRRGITIIIVSHQIEEVLSVAGRIILMKDGRVEFTGTTKEYLASVESPVPAITRVMRLLRERGFDVGYDVLEVDNAFEQIERLMKKEEGR